MANRRTKPSRRFARDSLDEEQRAKAYWRSIALQPNGVDDIVNLLWMTIKQKDSALALIERLHLSHQKGEERYIGFEQSLMKLYELALASKRIFDNKKNLPLALEQDIASERRIQEKGEENERIRNYIAKLLRDNPTLENKVLLPMIYGARFDLAIAGLPEKAICDRAKRIAAVERRTMRFAKLRKSS